MTNPSPPLEHRIIVEKGPIRPERRRIIEKPRVEPKITVEKPKAPKAEPAVVDNQPSDPDRAHLIRDALQPAPPSAPSAKTDPELEKSVRQLRWKHTKTPA